MSERPFRFGLQVFGASTRTAWQDTARRAEALGFATVLVPDHVASGLLAPMAALSTMAEATSRIRVGTFVLNNDFRHPGLLAREAAALDARFSTSTAARRFPQRRLWVIARPGRR